MTESEFLNKASGVLGQIEMVIESAVNNDENVDIDTSREGNVLTLTFENGSKIIINLQPSMKEVWIAAKSGGYHYRYSDEVLINTRNGQEFFKSLQAFVFEQSDLTLIFNS